MTPERLINVVSSILDSSPRNDCNVFKRLTVDRDPKKFEIVINSDKPIRVFQIDRNFINGSRIYIRVPCLYMGLSFINGSEIYKLTVSVVFINVRDIYKWGQNL